MIKTVLSFLVLLVFLSSQASAYLMFGNGRLDRAIYAGHDPKLIVAGQIVKKDVEPLSSVTGPANKVSFRFKIATVILGDGKYTGRTLTIQATRFIWPNNLVPFKTGIRAHLSLTPTDGETNATGTSYAMWFLSALRLCRLQRTEKRQKPYLRDRSLRS